MAQVTQVRELKSQLEASVDAVREDDTLGPGVASGSGNG